MPRQFAETKRFILREITHDDIDGFYELESDPEVHRYLGTQPIKKKEELTKVIDYIHRQYKENGIGRWAVEDKATGKFLGWAGLKLEDLETNGHVNYYDLGYRLIRKYWGQGVATECSIASVNYAFDVLKIPTLYGAAHVENTGSNIVLQKAGLKFIESFYYEHMKCNWYRLDKGEWERSRMKV